MAADGEVPKIDWDESIACERDPNHHVLSNVVRIVGYAVSGGSVG